MKFSSTDLRISTHTATCNINSFVNLAIISKYLQISDDIQYIEHGNFIKRGTNMKIHSKKAKAKKRVFFNQITFVIKPCSDRLNNVKLFNNGAISMTGLKNFDEGEKSIKILIDIIKDLKGVFYKSLTVSNIESIEESSINCKFCNNNVSRNNVKRTKCDHYICNLCSNIDHTNCKTCNTILIEKGILEPTVCKLKDYKIVLINSDYYLGFEVNRNILHELLCYKYNIFSSYEPCIYPGVNSKYYFNTNNNNKEYEGKCYCDVYCDGKGVGEGNGQCKKITVSIFQSGSIIITGARNMNQIKTAHKFINNVINDNYEKIKKDDVGFFNTNEKKKVIKLKKSQIINYPE
tara:strand:+ start:1140 stop:2183 length:1044 start_codon:yes stop_codon:yes gene_type:complete